ncbi:hypothetical protein A2778_00275 [Candidatus Daviesbacteria bacterium RIFCSPHIGHO2_01_FULL_40_24]|uniref:NHL repeat containing protein n=1 Tax=Candidatus Daviesbacteria bacterium GW2011_GWC2_40_12 TaxID=1618431 RepID=A0A0G0QY30_9BACT|nr:MAG: NHL repeat containing protein [Candidatus Daviesbacteria bacterium GW2011_GWA2_39_33]KKR42356.1 MAG: NHL repeat containing protein [Candidatus Daviesbacteria bacterium GW2011_GWC2_40_12]OGE22272.1 MAG: hypothetical protein A2778_00275 [Candidatus Daviesbacteria bacterium RIFCSPHIGHO2_01_FULL_40_24]OGE28359.1 MAG: hypothetical protein A3C29_05270 [Candidatus Daviesbacteria bacterium RIFCSPHIGHO2_02_FULL_40_16]OGE41990.1 MAG: hypothetical protein A3A53_03775 [Candidatus Daviesbacteria bac
MNFSSENEIKRVDGIAKVIKRLQNVGSLLENAKLVKISLAVSLVVLILLTGGVVLYLKNNVVPELAQNSRGEPQFQQAKRPGEINVKATGSKYKTVSQKPTNGWFKTGQDADIMLSGVDFNNTGGALSFHHPGGIATDGKRLLLADTWNNRILIWNKLPTNGNTPPDLVLGQKDFISNNPGTGLDQLNWPISVSIAKDKVVVADTNNARILIWNSFPTSNAKAADFTIETKNSPGEERGISLIWPWGAWTDGEKLAITSTHGAGTVYLWNTFPANADQKPDVILRDKDFGTPRTITSNGKYLFVSDHNAKVSTKEMSKEGGGAATFVWKNWPNGDVPHDFVMNDWQSGVFLPDGKLALVGPLSPLMIWNKPPETGEDKADLTIGVANMGPFTTGAGYQFVTGDSSGLAFGDGRIYIGMGNGNKVVVYNKIPTSQTDFPDFAIGSPDINTNTLETNYIVANPILATDGKSLVTTSDFDRKMYVWKSLPDESGAYPDFVYTFNDTCHAVDNSVWGGNLLIGGRKTICYWKKLPINGEMPDKIFNGKIGSVEYDSVNGLAQDDKYFYLSAIKEGLKTAMLYVWEGVPDEGSRPIFSIPIDDLGRLDSDGRYLVGIVARKETIGVLEIDKLSTSSQLALVPADKISQNAPIRFNGPGSVVTRDNHLIASDVGFGRVMVWTNISDALAGKSADIVLGEENLQDTKQEIGRNKLFWPASLTFDGSFLWVGETKFSNRILRFSIH